MKNGEDFMAKINEKYTNRTKKPNKVLMFGEGNFLRAFIGRIVKNCNDVCAYNGGIVALQGVERGMSEVINAQDGLYTLVERGYENGGAVCRETVMDCLNGCINPYEDYQAFLATAREEGIRVVISNTTEFGICYDQSETSLRPHKNFPAKLTDWLNERFRALGGRGGVLILPCELIDHNADRLSEYVLRYAREWGLSEEFFVWLKEKCRFCNTLVDRVVSGYPSSEAKEMEKKFGYEDSLIDVCEPFLLWVIDSAAPIDEYIPVSKCGLNIVVTTNFESYRTRKVRILNGAHTGSVLAGHLCGFETVDQLVADPVFFSFIGREMKEEVIPSFQGEHLQEYAEEVFERFRNPFIHHRLTSIALNSVSKFRARVLSSISDCVKKGIYPRRLFFSLAALLVFYEREADGAVNDEAIYTERFKKYFDEGKTIGRREMLRKILSDEVLWGEDLTKISGLYEQVAADDERIGILGMYKAVAEAARGQK